MFTLSKEDIYELPEERRKLYLRILEAVSYEPFIGPRLKYLEDHFPPHRLDEALKWLVSNDLVGAKFTSWYASACGRSDLEMCTRLVSVVNNSEVTTLIAGKSFKV